MIGPVLIAIAGLMGAAGVALAAAAAHTSPGAGLDVAAYMLLFHAVAVVAMTAILDRGLAWRPLAVAGTIGLAVGAVLFSGDLAFRAFASARLFPMAAPTGGSILILSWLVIAGAGLAAMVRRR